MWWCLGNMVGLESMEANRQPSFYRFVLSGCHWSRDGAGPLRGPEADASSGHRPHREHIRLEWTRLVLFGMDARVLYDFARSYTLLTWVLMGAHGCTKQQLKARQMVLRQQAASAAQAASKTQREVR